MHLDRYAELAWRDLPSFNESTWCAIFDALGAVAPVPIEITAVAAIAGTVTHALERGELAKKWKIDAKQVIAAARGWTFGQACAVADAAIRFHRALAQPGTDAIHAAGEATKRPAAIVLVPPASAARTPARTKRR